MNVGIACLFPMEDETAQTQIVSGVCPVYAVDGVLPKVTFLSGFLHSVFTQIFDLQLIDTPRCFKEKVDRARILTNWKRAGLRQTDVLSDQFERKIGFRAR